MEGLVMHILIPANRRETVTLDSGSVVSRTRKRNSTSRRRHHESAGKQVPLRDMVCEVEDKWQS
jgi:hypothetical protein